MQPPEIFHYYITARFTKASLKGVAMTVGRGRVEPAIGFNQCMMRGVGDNAKSVTFDNIGGFT